MIELIGIRTGSLIDEKSGAPVTRVVLDLSGPVKYKSGTLTEPERLFVDLTDTREKVSENDIVVKDGVIQNIRIGQVTTRRTRVVLDLVKSLPYNIFTLEADKDRPFRVVIDLSKSSTPEVPSPDQVSKPKAAVPQDLKGKIIVIDPGHGGQDPGAIGLKGTKEKDVTLDIAKRVTAILGARGAKVLMTRSTDKFISLEGRVSFANANKANLFVSIHINSSTIRKPEGIETYYYPRSQAGRNLALKVQAGLITKLGWKNRGTKTASFYVIRHTKMPACLAEIGFISNPVQEDQLRKSPIRQKAAEGVANGVINYLKR